MEDYTIKELSPGEFGVTVQTERAQNRRPGGLAIGTTIVFKGLDENLYEFIAISEAQGFTFSGKSVLDKEIC